MQNSVLKFLIIFFVWVGLSTNPLQAASSPALSRADSLFQQKRYTQSFEIYRSIFENHHYTPAMLLKMAFIEEGLNRPAEAMYYLNVYYLATQDPSVLTKMNELASKFKLEGFETDESDKIFTYYLKYYTNISFVILFLLLFFAALMFITKFRYRQNPYASFTFFVLFSAVLLIHLNFGKGRPTAIITKNNTYLMDGPSSAASVVRVVRDGHRVKLKGKKDVWIRAVWDGQEVYIKETNLQVVEL